MAHSTSPETAEESIETAYGIKKVTREVSSQATGIVGVGHTASLLTHAGKTPTMTFMVSRTTDDVVTTVAS